MLSRCIMFCGFVSRRGEVLLMSSSSSADMGLKASPVPGDDSQPIITSSDPPSYHSLDATRTGGPSDSNTAESSSAPPKTPPTGRPWLKILILTVIGLCLAAFVITFVAIPVAFYASSPLRRLLVFATTSTSDSDLQHPAAHGLSCGQNYYVKGDADSRLGTWFVPNNATPYCGDDSNLIADNLTMVLYLHGVGNTRAHDYRVHLYQVLSTQTTSHVVTFDYRGFGDSTRQLPSLQRVVEDSIAAYRDVREFVPRERIIVWGHSLGTSIAMYVAAALHEQGDSPRAVVLEASFNNLAEVARWGPALALFRWLPYFEQVFPNRIMSDPATAFNSTSMADRIDPHMPILMLHAEDDPIVPFESGRRLFDDIKRARAGKASAAPVEFRAFSAKYGHNLISHDPAFPGIIQTFIDQTTGQISGR